MAVDSINIVNLWQRILNRLKYNVLLNLSLNVKKNLLDFIWIIWLENLLKLIYLYRRLILCSYIVDEQFENYFHSELVRADGKVNLELVALVSWNSKEH